LSAQEKSTQDVVKDKVRSQKQVILAKQNDLMSQLRGLGATELARVHVAHNAVAIRVDAANLQAIAALPGVAKVRPVITYEMALSDTVPYIGAAAVQAAGKDGTGVRVAVIDSGIDYTHYNLGGAGTAEAYAAAYGAGPSDPKNTTRDGLFPTAKVVDGYDFVGDAWPNGARTEDPDPIDYQGHGTHVADIIAGHSADGMHKGVAPGASLVAIKVCSSVATSCNGIALLKAMDYALDPNGDGDTSDAVDVINMSLGSAYGQVEDDLTLASTNAVKLGVVVVAAAGNNGNRPYIVSSPSIAPGVISVAQTAVPSDKAYPLTVNSPAGIAGSYGNTATMDWAPVAAGFTGNVAVAGRGCPAGSGVSVDDPYLSDISGKIALIDRGVCSVSLKVDRAARAGAVGVIIGLVASGDAVSFSNGGGSMFVPTVVIQQSLSNAIKANAAAPVNVTLSSGGVALVGSMASTSARGPSVSWSSIKPEIGAPGASVSAIAGSGTGQEAFGGTSGATPMIAGSAALLLQGYPTRPPKQVKAMLMNSAETTIYTNNALLPGQLAPITRIGAGEVRVDRAVALTSFAMDSEGLTGALSFGFVDVASSTTISRSMIVRNVGKATKTFTITPGFRSAAKAASGAVTVTAPSTVTVPAGGKATVKVTMKIDPTLLPDWTLNGGSQGGNGALLNGFEYDGYIILSSGGEGMTGERLSVPWQVLPRKAGAIEGAPDTVTVGGQIKLKNKSAVDAGFEVFALTGVSGKAPKEDLPMPGDNYALIDLRAVGVRAVGDYLQFAINTYGRRAHPNYPAEFDIGISLNRKAVTDFIVYNAELTGFGATGQNAVFVYNTATGSNTAYFYTDADLQSGNVIMTVPMAALGITADSTIQFTVNAYDNYFTGLNTDGFGTMTFTPSMPRYVLTGLPPLGTPLSLPGKSAGKIGTAAMAGGEVISRSQKGFLFMYRRSASTDAAVVRVTSP
jgi:subtilisin family serine protease